MGLITLLTKFQLSMEPIMNEKLGFVTGTRKKSSLGNLATEV